MYHLRFVVLMLAVVLFSGSGLFSQEKKDTKEPVKGMLPTYWKSLGLSKEQTQEVYSIQAKYKAEMQKLEEQIADLKAKNRKDLEKVLTDTQKAELRKIIAEKAGLSPETKKDKSKTDK